MQRRVAVTGLGAISALGVNVDQFQRALAEGRSGIAPIQRPPAGLRFSHGAEAPFDAAAFFDAKQADFLDRFAQMGVAAAREAVADSGIDFKGGLGASSAIVTGSCLGGKVAEEEGYAQLYRDNNTRFNPLSIPRAMSNAAASRISLEYGITGPVYTAVSYTHLLQARDLLDEIDARAYFGSGGSD